MVARGHHRSRRKHRGHVVRGRQLMDRCDGSFLLVAVAGGRMQALASVLDNESVSSAPFIEGALEFVAATAANVREHVE